MDFKHKRNEKNGTKAGGLSEIEIPVTERLPEEHDSLFTKLKGTDEWKKEMFASVSDDVLVTIEREDGGLEKCQTAKIIDGEWKNTFLRTFSGAKVLQGRNPEGTLSNTDVLIIIQQLLDDYEADREGEEDE